MKEVSAKTFIASDFTCDGTNRYHHKYSQVSAWEEYSHASADFQRPHTTRNHFGRVSKLSDYPPQTCLENRTIVDAHRHKKANGDEQDNISSAVSTRGSLAEWLLCPAGDQITAGFTRGFCSLERYLAMLNATPDSLTTRRQPHVSRPLDAAQATTSTAIASAG